MTTTEYNDLCTALAHLNLIDLKAVDRQTEDAVEVAINLMVECLVERQVEDPSPSSRTHWYGANGWVSFKNMDDFYVFNTYNYLLRRGEMSTGISVEFVNRNLCDRQAEMSNPNNLYRLKN